jgi:hypothetical protein
MAHIKIDDLVDHLDSEFKKALDDTMRHFAPEAQYDRTRLFKFFLTRVYHHCSVWENIPDKLVKE